MTETKKKILSSRAIREKNQTLREEREKIGATIQDLSAKEKPKKKAIPKKEKEAAPKKVKTVKADSKIVKPKKGKKIFSPPSIDTQETDQQEQDEAQEGAQQVIKKLGDSYETPVLAVKYSSVKRPYKFANNDIPRYSITLILDDKKNRSFIDKLEGLRARQGAEKFRTEISFINNRGFKLSTGKSLIKFQRKEKIPIFDTEGYELELTDEIPEKTRVSVTFEVKCYLNKRTNQNAFNFSPSKIVIHETKEKEENEKENP